METPDWWKKWRSLAQKTVLGSGTFANHRVNSLRDYFVVGIIALCFGVVVKVLVHGTLTIGYNDYTLSRDQGIIDLNTLEKHIIARGGIAASVASVPSGDTCSDMEE